MRLYVPSYYEKFHCIAGACRHSCCIGWEIDIDEETRERYEHLSGALGDRIRASMVTEGETTCFRLTDGERCPHLNADGLCDIILGAGEDYLSDICHYHPRYRSFFSDREEMGLGLTCETAVHLVLSEREKVTYRVIEDDGEREALTEEERMLFATRDACVQLAQDRTLPVSARLDRLAAGTGQSMPTVAQWASFLRDLERLDPAWDTCLDQLPHLSEMPENTGATLFDTTIEIAAEQFLVYLLHRHLSDEACGMDLRPYIAFVVMSCRTVLALAACHGTSCPLDILVDIVRMWSSEIEYSTENKDMSLACFDETD